jgi:hypothetical protein
LSFQCLDFEPDEGEGSSRNAACALILISTFLFSVLPLVDTLKKSENSKQHGNFTESRDVLGTCIKSEKTQNNIDFNLIIKFALNFKIALKFLKFLINLQKIIYFFVQSLESQGRVDNVHYRESCDSKLYN